MSSLTDVILPTMLLYNAYRRVVYWLERPPRSR